MIFHLYLSIGAVLLCLVVLALLKYIAISKMRIDSRDQKKKPKLTTTDVLTLLRNLKPFPVSAHAGWKLNSVANGSRVWAQEVSFDSQSASFHIFAAFKKVRIPSQTLLQILKDVSKTPCWKPGCLATSITSKATEEESNTRVKGIMGSLPVQHDIVIEETSRNNSSKNIWNLIFSGIEDMSSVTMEHNRYWHREDNGVCWHLQMSEMFQEWLFFLAQPVENVDECLLTIVGYQGGLISAGKFVSDTLSSIADYLYYRKIVSTPLKDIKQPSARSGGVVRSYSSSEDQGRGNKGMFLRFRSLVEKPNLGADKLYSIKQQLLRSASILRHRSPTFTNGFDDNVTQGGGNLKTASLDRRKDMPKLQPMPTSDESSSTSLPTPVCNKDGIDGAGDIGSVTNSADNNSNVSKLAGDDSSKSDSVMVGKAGSEGTDSGDDKQGKDMDRTLDADVDDQERYEQINNEITSSLDSKEDIKKMVMANHIAAELLTVAIQASNIDLSKSIQDQVLNSGGWMFCGLENDVVVLKKVSIRENIHCYLGKGVIQASPTTVWNAIRNPRTRFTYDDSLKKVDVLEKMTDSIKIVYYYHEVLQLFKTESFDMIVTQSERVDNGDKYVLAMQSADKEGVTVPESTTRIKLMPSGWIIEPVNKDRKIYSMVTYIVQIDHREILTSSDRTPFEDFIAKQPMCIAYLRQYLKGCAYLK